MYGFLDAMFQNQFDFPFQAAQSRPQGKYRCFRAIYDYKAQDSDEISFNDGDVIVNCVAVDEGWMTGTVHRTGEYGMLPANYVEAVDL
jgi:hypothetical protein